MNYANVLMDFFKAGFAQVNYTLAVVIALYWAWRMPEWSAIVATAIGAVLMHLVAIVLAPVVDHNGPLHLPAYQDAGFWRFVAALFLGYTVVIGVLFLLKSLVLNRGAGDSEAVGGLLMAGATAGAVAHGTGDHHGGGHDDHGHGGGHEDHGHGGGHDDHGHGGGHDDHGHGGGHDGHGGGHDDHGHDHGHGGGHGDHHGHH
jgi:hypothetical protein